MGLFSKKKSEVAQDTNTNLQKIKDDIEEEIEGLDLRSHGEKGYHSD